MPAKITIINNGPVKVEGDFALADVEGKEFGLGARPAIFLCRCGHSQNKPFCDGSHKTSGFQHEAKARDLA
ncbi:MAG: CDGSH iron-sulfur domain-containing protein [Acidobacteriota bacterium]